MKIAPKLGRSMANRADRKLTVTGSVGPTEDMMKPFDQLTDDIAKENLRKHIERLEAGRADGLWLETYSALEE